MRNRRGKKITNYRRVDEETAVVEQPATQIEPKKPIVTQASLPAELLTAILGFTDNKTKNHTRLVSKRWHACTKAAIDFEQVPRRKAANQFFNRYLTDGTLSLDSPDQVLNNLKLLIDYLTLSLPGETAVIKQHHSAVALSMLMQVMHYLNKNCGYSFTLPEEHVDNAVMMLDCDNYISIPQVTQQAAASPISQAEVDTCNAELTDHAFRTTVPPFLKALAFLAKKLNGAITQAQPGFLNALTATPVQLVYSLWGHYGNSQEMKAQLFPLLTKTMTVIKDRLDELTQQPAPVRSLRS